MLDLNVTIGYVPPCGCCCSLLSVLSFLPSVGRSVYRGVSTLKSKQYSGYGAKAAMKAMHV